VTVGARDDDAIPFALAVSIASHRGQAIGWTRRRADLRRNEWVVDAPADLIDLVAWLRAVAPPLAPRLTTLLPIVEAAAALLRGPSPVPAADLTALARRAGDITSHAAPLPAPTALESASDERIWWEVSGLLAADGHLAIRDRHARFAPMAIVSQRTDNLALLQAVHERTGIGDLAVRATQATWRVARAADVAVLAERLREHPLPLASRKRSQLEIWTSAVAMKTTGRSARSRLADAADALRRARRYDGPRLLCGCDEAAPASSEDL
jgi:hypothetical protein